MKWYWQCFIYLTFESYNLILKHYTLSISFCH